MNQLKFIATMTFCVLFAAQIYAAKQIPLHVNNSMVGAPLTMGIPFAQGELMSPDHVRVLDQNGNEIPSQTTLVTTWEPLDFSVKWIWVFFFSTGAEDYTLEYGSDVRKAPITGDKIKVKNAQRTSQSSYVQTGPLKFTVDKRSGGFIDDVLLDLDRNGFGEGDTIAQNDGGRGSFLDLLDDLGVDSSTAIIHRTIREKGSGPLHTILRLEGEYTYQREDNRNSPFIIRIHLYAGQSYIRVFHTLTYTGVPDKHIPTPGQHGNIALDATTELKDDSETTDQGWMEPNDQIQSVGLALKYRLSEGGRFRAGYRDGMWWEKGESKTVDVTAGENQMASVYQTGPKPDRIPPVPNSTMEERITGFEAHIDAGNGTPVKMEKAEGWADLTGSKYGVGVGICNFLEEYPKEITFDTEDDQLVAFLWSPKAGPMSFARASLRRDQGMISNFAEGVTKTSEIVFYFHSAETSDEDVKRKMNYFLNPSIPHASPETYSNSGVYGYFSPRQDNNAGLERALDYKFDWQLYSQQWEPWYGMFDYGDQKNFFFRDDWFRWQNNEPAIDYMFWLQFMRTGEPKYYKAAEAMSRHTMDVDNVHWPTEPIYDGATNDAIDWWRHASREPSANPYLGIGRRHANQHWAALLSAHVWLQGWVASYYLTGYHRGLDVARLSADSHTRRIWGNHGLTGRRLYLSLWNLTEAWDATKDPKYLEDLKDRVRITMEFQNGPDQYDNLAIDRYGYSQIYASQALYKYYQLTQDEKVKHSLIRHARAVRDNPPYNHEYESYFATIHSLVVGHELTGEESFLNEAIARSETMKSDEIDKPFSEMANQKMVVDAINESSNLPRKGDFAVRERSMNQWDPVQGLRVFGWTHIYNVPWLLHAIRSEKK